MKHGRKTKKSLIKNLQIIHENPEQTAKAKLLELSQNQLYSNQDPQYHHFLEQSSQQLTEQPKKQNYIILNKGNPKKQFDKSDFMSHNFERYHKSHQKMNFHKEIKELGTSQNKYLSIFMKNPLPLTNYLIMGHPRISTQNQINPQSPPETKRYHSSERKHSESGSPDFTRNQLTSKRKNIRLRKMFQQTQKIKVKMSLQDDNDNSKIKYHKQNEIMRFQKIDRPTTFYNAHHCKLQPHKKKLHK